MGGSGDFIVFTGERFWRSRPGMFVLNKDRLSSTQVKMLFLGKTRLPNSLNIEFDGVIIFL